MDIKEIIAELPEASHVRRVVEFCSSTLELKDWEIRLVLETTARILHGLSDLEHEGRRARGELKREQEQRMEDMARPFAELLRTIEDPQFKKRLRSALGIKPQP